MNKCNLLWGDDGHQHCLKLHYDYHDCDLHTQPPKPSESKTVEDEIDEILNELKGILALERNMVNLAFDPYADAKSRLLTLMNEERLNEAFLIGIKHEKGEYLPASYLIDRRAELEKGEHS